MAVDCQTNNIPNFLIIGAAKCGTTTIHHMLGQHPDIFMSDPKEPFFFEYEYERGISYYRKKYFSGYNGQGAAGEARVANLLLPFVPERIHDCLPHARLIAILRNPVDRAYSHWWMKYSRGQEKLPFERAIQVNLQRLKSGQNLEGRIGEKFWQSHICPKPSPHVDLPIYLDAGHYALQLKRYFRLFPKRQIKVFYFEQLCSDLVGLFRSLCSFLGVSEDVSSVRIPHENNALPAVAIPFLRLDTRWHISLKLPTVFRSAIRKLLCRFGKQPSMNPAFREMLLQYYYPYNRDLERLMGRSFSSWNQ